MPSDATSSALPPGTMVAHYRIERELGSGASGTVYLAHDTALDRAVAVKVLRPEIAGRADLVARFFREARAAARVSHPNLAHVYYVGESGPLRFFAMEHVPGVTLEEHVRANGPRPLAEVVDLLVQAGRGLAAAHGAGVVHRDVKPSNLILATDGTVKVTDFGLAKSIDGDVERTAAGTLVGTPLFMSPEQCRGEEAGPAADVYALGLVAWFLLCGRPPYGAGALGRVLHDQMSTPLPPLERERPDLPPATDGVLADLTAKDPVRRPATMEDAIRRLERLRPRALHPAPLTARGFAFLIDGLTLAAVIAFLAMNLASLVDMAFGAELPGVVPELLTAGVALVTQWWMEVRRGQTVGKMMLNLAVVREDGLAASARTLFARFLLRWPTTVIMLPGEPSVLDAAELVLMGTAIVGGVAVHAVTRGRTLSDVLTRTRVVYRLPAPPSA